MTELAEKLAGRFIVIDGPDGAGKTTQLKLLRDHLTEHGAVVEVTIDPGTTKIGRKIRSLLLDRDNGEISPMCETLLFMASRAQLMEERILPALAQRKVVLCDRFVSATVAYQGASGVDKKMIVRLGDIAITGHWPDLTIVLDVPVQRGFQRLGIDRARLKKPAQEELHKLGGPAKGKKTGRDVPAGQLFLFGDRMEYRSSIYHEAVRTIFKELAKHYPAKVCHVDGVGTETEVFGRVIAAVLAEFGA